MRLADTIINDIAILENQQMAVMNILGEVEEKELDLEPEHRKMVSELMNSDFIAKLPNQIMRDDALENYILNNPEYSDRHRAYLEHKALVKKTYRTYRYIEDCIKNRRAELQAVTFGGKNETN